MFRQKKRYLTVLLLIAAFTMVIAGCGSNSGSTNTTNNSATKQSDKSNKDTSKNTSQGKPKQGGEITIAYNVDITNFDPIKGTTGNDHALLWPVYDTLVKFSPDLKPEPGLATSWEYPDKKTLVLHLRKGVTFQDGTPFNAEAVKFNIERVNSKDSNIVDLKNVKSVEVVDTHTVKLHLSKPDSSILLALTDRGGMMVSPTAVKKYGKDYPQHPVGAGPFKVTNHVPNGKIVYEKYKNYWNEGHPYLDKMTVKVIPDANSEINALKSGQVDITGVLPQTVSSLKNNPDINIIKKPTLGLVRLYLKTNVEPFNKKAVRLAVLYGINRKQLVKAVNFGVGRPAFQPFPKGYWAHNDSISATYNPEKSKQLLKDAGLDNVSFSLLTYPIDYWKRLANAIKAQLAEVGITVNIKTMKANAAVQKFLGDKNFDALTGGWSGRADPQMTINGLYSKDSFYNPGKFTTPKLQSLISEAASTYDQDKRAELYGKIVNEAIVQQGMGIPLISKTSILALNKRIHGYQPNLLGKPIFSTIWVDQK